MRNDRKNMVGRWKEQVVDSKRDCTYRKWLSQMEQEELIDFS